MTVEEGDHAVVQKIGRRDRRLAIIELGASNLGIGVDKGLLVDTPDALQIANIERVLGAAVARMLALKFAMGLLLGLGLFQRDELGLLEAVEAVAAITHHLAGLAHIAKLLGKLQEPDLGADDLLFGGHGVLPFAEAGRYATPTAPRPASTTVVRGGQNTTCQIKS